MAAAMGGEGAGKDAERLERLAREDPLYERALMCVQQGRWADAEEAVGELQARYAGSPSVQAVQEALSLHLSAERSWGPESRRKAQPKVPSKTPSKAPGKVSSMRMRVLVVANVALYMLVLLTWLLLQIKRLLG